MRRKRSQSPIASVKRRHSSLATEDPSTSGEGQSASSDSAKAPDCPICLESILEKEVKTLDCTHVFHRTCINEWLVESGNCPVCRHESAPPQNARPSSIFRELRGLMFETHPWMRWTENNALINNGGIGLWNSDGRVRQNNNGIGVNTRPPSTIRELRGLMFETHPWMRRTANNALINNGGIGLRNSDGRVRRNNNGIGVRQNNSGNEMRLGNGGTEIRQNNEGIGRRLNNPFSMTLNNGGSTRLIPDNRGSIGSDTSGMEMRLNVDSGNSDDSE